MRKISVLIFILGLFPWSVLGQDSIPLTQEIDTTVVDTVVIRATQEKIKNVTRGINLVNPFISFKKTKPLNKRIKRFRVPSFWEKVNQIGVNMSEVAFVNWNAGGDNSITALGNMKFSRNYKFRYIQWDNLMDLRYGWNAQEGRVWRKTDDAIRLSSTFAYRRDTISNWYYSVKANFNTQFSNGFRYPDRETPISRFMAPGYFFLGAGASFIPEGKKFNLYISPITHKSTYVLDQDLANRGAFGVERALVDAEGNILREGKRVFMEFGFLVSNDWETEIYKNMVLKNRVNLYTDYLQSFGNVDVDWELNLNLTVNDFVNAVIGTHLIYDDDVLFNREVAPDGTVINPGKTRIQFKQLLGVGLAYSF
ncbi:DUF3078 domain-containing protein [Arenibacter sp. GZD96]|uniref:DUF3078 domain-containing protein n=1 Tax=Aurantibrevibacter litoralis TaxID=3106030 RepID=UPI002AFF24D9|nr:DUF3078 domain-containing protein [Arenibacter sp. GZD-96]MEA1787600.1 DUF3078 domain-containing protein [Arenibacter sp. GZD-96]